jgi:hypothetical protein
MTIFEYLMVMVSIILGLSITQVLRGLSKIARSPRRSVAATLYGVFLFALHVQTWWALWDLSVVPEWNFLLFILLISIPSILFATTETLFPMATTAETDWNAHYEAVRKLFLSVLALWTTLALLETVTQVGHGPVVALAVEEKLVVRRQLEWFAVKLVEIIIHVELPYWVSPLPCPCWLSPYTNLIKKPHQLW